MSGRLSSNVKRHTVKNVTLAVDTGPETIENETVKSKVPSASVPSAEGEILQSSNLKCFGFNELKTATRNFRPHNMAEVNSIGKLHHPNLMRLIGYCLQDSCRFLAYEFMPRGSLDNHLFRWYFQSQPLPWSLRIKI
ncbi:unnamed protein product, partial [Prunus brigantina]